MKKALSHILLMLMSLYTLAGASQTLLIVGDSLSASYNIPLEKGWVPLLEKRIHEKYPGISVVNASISGETTGNALKRLPDILDKHQPEIVVIELGGNDGLRGFQLPSIKDNLNQMISMAKNQGATVVLTGIHIPPNYGPAYTQIFYKAYKELAEKHETIFVPFILKGVGDNPELMQADGVHPTAEAQPKVLENMWPYIKKAIEQQTN
ncbi:arylesterase [Pleionea sediminis]|uniref:arylesterase n=1 Tax=Pleionea sediminis TaxID=2569479 RepID=UPI0011867B43|nr:arylesterase [Pleionea sediminis]